MAHFSRMLRHFAMTPWQARRFFPATALKAIESAITKAERTHGGEIRFAIEAELSTADLWRKLPPRARALQVFGELGVWDTANNNGVLIYVLLADRDVEIIADRGYLGKVSAEEWASVAAVIERAFRSGEYERGAIEGIELVSKLIQRHYPDRDGNELPNAPAML